MKSVFFRKVISMTMGLAVTAGIACMGAVTARAAETDVVPLTAVQKLENNSTISSTLISKGESVTVNAKASGGNGGYTYAVLYKKKSEKDWTVRQGYKDNDTIIVKPAKDTDYDVCAKVKDSTGTVAKKFFTVKVNPKLQNNSLISDTTIRHGGTVTAYAYGKGGVGKYTYAVLYKKLTDKNWTVRQGYKDNYAVTIRPAKIADYSICVKIKDENGVIAKKFFTVHVVDYAQEVIKLSNEERSKAGLPPLAYDSKLAAAANKRAEEIAEVFAHTRPDGTDCFTVLDEYGIKIWAAGENIAGYYSDPEEVVEAWMNSQGHRENILDSYFSHIGVGVYEDDDGCLYWVQIFATLR